VHARSYDRFRWKCYTPKVHRIEKLKFLSTNSKYNYTEESESLDLVIFGVEAFLVDTLIRIARYCPPKDVSRGLSLCAWWVCCILFGHNALESMPMMCPWCRGVSAHDSSLCTWFAFEPFESSLCTWSASLCAWWLCFQTFALDEICFRIFAHDGIAFTPVAGSNLLAENISILWTCSRNSCFWIPFYCFHSLRLWSGLGERRRGALGQGKTRVKKLGRGLSGILSGSLSMYIVYTYPDSTHGSFGYKQHFCMIKSHCTTMHTNLAFLASASIATWRNGLSARDKECRKDRTPNATNQVSTRKLKCTAYPIWDTIFEKLFQGSKLKAWTSLFTETRRSSFELWDLKQHSKMSPQVVQAVSIQHCIGSHLIWISISLVSFQRSVIKET